jgi:hypothetical protein
MSCGIALDTLPVTAHTASIDNAAATMSTMTRYIESPAEIAIASIRRELQRLSETIAVCARHIEDDPSPETMRRVGSVYAKLAEASSTLDDLRAHLRRAA